MAQRKPYGQFCGLARALDHVGDRWTLLVVRELLLGDRSFRDLQSALDGISPSLLTQRLTNLVADGLVERNDAPRRSKDVEYRLTGPGRTLEPVIFELIRWGSRWMLNGPGDDHVDQRWAPLALRALLEGRPSRPGRVHLDVDGIEVTVAGATRGRRVTPGHDGRPDATVAAPLPAILAVAIGEVPLRGSGAHVAGDGDIASQVLSARSGPS